jgi:hypothetical protein
MKLFASFLLVGIFITASAFQEKQNDVGETITWSPTTKITWQDFKKSLKGDAIEAAYSVCGIYISSHPKQLNDSTLQIEIHSFFSKTLSSKSTEKDILQDKVLVHEQGHFDINEWFSRILRKEITETRFKSIADFYKNVQTIYNKVNSASAAKQVLYDKATRHSINVPQQEKWNKMIADSLAYYGNYTQTELTITIKN